MRKNKLVIMRKNTRKKKIIGERLAQNAQKAFLVLSTTITKIRPRMICGMMTWNRITIPPASISPRRKKKESPNTKTVNS